MKALSLSDRQLHLVQQAAKAIPPKRRGWFLEKLAAHLAPEPCDAAVQAAVNVFLDRVPVYSTPDAKTVVNK